MNQLNATAKFNTTIRSLIPSVAITASTLSPIIGTPNTLINEPKMVAVSVHNNRTFSRQEIKLLYSTYSNHVAIVCSKARTSRSYKCKLPELTKCKYLLRRDSTMAEFMMSVRKVIRVSSHTALFFTINEFMVSPTNYVGELYDKYASADNVLYVCYSGENVFGGGCAAS